MSYHDPTDEDWFKHRHWVDHPDGTSTREPITHAKEHKPMSSQLKASNQIPSDFPVRPLRKGDKATDQRQVGGLI